MKPCKMLVCMLLCLTTAAAFSQKNDQQKPKLFAGYPQEIQLSKNLLQNTLGVSEGEQVLITFNDNFHFKGTVISKLQKYDNLLSVLIRSAAFGNSVFQVSKMINEDKSISYTGRIINPDAQDGYEIKRDMNDNYSLVKIETKNILEDCSY